MICEKCKPTELKAMRALESLTPNGSEFVNDPERCVAFVRRSQATQMQVLINFKKRCDELQKMLVIARVGVPHAFSSVTCKNPVECDRCAIEAVLRSL